MAITTKESILNLLGKILQRYFLFTKPSPNSSNGITKINPRKMELSTKYKIYQLDNNHLTKVSNLFRDADRVVFGCQKPR